MSDLNIMDRKIIHVAVAVIKGKDGRILVAKRPDDKHMGGYWEFPGGKVEPGEAVNEALVRELKEELGIDALSYQPLIKIKYDYPDKSVLLDTWVVNSMKGMPSGMEGQDIKWADESELSNLKFPDANGPILNAVKLPDQYMVTGKFQDESELFEKVCARLSEGVRLIQFRAPWLSISSYINKAKRLHSLIEKSGGKLLLKGEPELLMEPWCDGIHLRAEQLYKESHDWVRFRRTGQWLAASCHNAKEVELANQLAMDFITISPVQKTKTHPEKMPLGWLKAAELTKLSVVPAFWLGGLGINDINTVQESGGQGVAAIGSFWR